MSATRGVTAFRPNVMKRSIPGSLFELTLAFVGVGACAPPPVATGAFVPQPVTLPAQPPPPRSERPLEPTPTDAAGDGAAHDADVDREERAPATALPVSWAETFGHTRPFAEAMALARGTRATFDSAVASGITSADGGPPAPRRFEQASSLLDQASRRFAAAYHAPDATAGDKVDALREAAAMILAWSRTLDEAGLARAPASYRSDPSIALTFEDVANGPAKRWREEGVALVQRCVDSARASRIDSPAARDCTAMRQVYVHVLARRAPTRVDAGAASDTGACACDPGDPLCSASMSGWCRPQ